MHLDTNSFREQPLIWQTSWQRSADARQELLNFPHYREVLPTWHPEWIFDEAFMVGGAAVKAADEGDTGKMVVIDPCFR